MMCDKEISFVMDSSTAEMSIRTLKYLLHEWWMDYIKTNGIV